MSPRNPVRHPRPGAGRKAPADPGGPIDTDPIDTGADGSTDPTVPDEFTFGSMFRVLDRKLPLALLPLRLEARFWMATTPPELRVRIFPDVVHADGHLPALTATEHALGQAYWRRCWRAGPPPAFTAGHDAAFAWLAGHTGPWRAAWVARETAPLNPEEAPPGPVPSTVALRPAPRFPAAAKPRAPGGPVHARLLPSRFALVLYADGSLLGTWWGEEVAEDLALAPGLVEAGDDLDGRALLDAQGLTWTHDFNVAVEAGMAIRVNFSELPENVLRDGFSKLLVLGVRTTDQQAELEELLEAHRYTHGLDVIPQGTPTNATETAAPGISLERPDLAAVRASEFPVGKAPSVPAPRGARTVDPFPETPAVEQEGDLYRMTAAAAATAALGLAGDGALERAENARLDELRRAEAMAKALWPGLLGHYLDALMHVGLNAPNRAWLRDWSAHYVRGGGMLPTLLVGSQPYGLLPVGKIDTPAAPVGRVQHLETVLGLLRPDWNDALPGVARLDPEAGDAAPGEGERAALVSQILGGVPHPAAFSLQRVDDKRSTYATQWDWKLSWAMLGAATAPNLDGSPSVVETLPSSWEDNHHAVNSVLWGEWLILRDALIAATTPDEQIEALTNYAAVQAALGDDATDARARDYYAQWEAYTRTNLIDFVAAHVSRTEPAAWLLDLVPDITRMIDDEGDPAAFFAVHPSRSDLTLPLVAPGRTEADVDELRNWLNALASDLAAGLPPDHDYGGAHPLLRQLLAWSAERAAGTDDAGTAQDGLATLLGVAHTAADPIGELERLLRETVSTYANRLDAWYTGVAAARLENKRQATAGGIQVGAYGWLENLRPREKRASQGYVLAPSPAHATTAAILRSGWSAFGGDAESAGLAVDLSSDRIRRARWLMDGVRLGQDLGALLGARLERRLQDAGLAAQIEDVRAAALRAAGSAAAATAIVDGLLVARGRAYQQAPADERDGYDAAEQAAADELATLLADPELSAAERTALGDALDGGLDDLDAMADAAVAQSVFSLTEGNVPEAATSLTAAATGEVAFPRLRFADGRRAATTITHRMVLLVEPDATGTWPGAKTSGRALAAPALEAWLEGVLGDPERFAFAVTFRDPADGAAAAPPLTRTLADVGLAALDVVALAPAGEETGLGRLGAVLASWAEGLRPAGLDGGTAVVLDTHAGDPSLDDLAVAGRAVRALLDDARDLDGRDLAAPGATGATSGLDAGALEPRIRAVRTALETGDAAVAKALAGRGDLRAALLALGGFALPGTVPRGTDSAVHAEQAAAVRTAIETRLTALDAGIKADTAGWEDRDEDSRWRALRDRLQLLVGESLALAAPFAAADGPGLDATFGRPRLGPDDATRWLAASGRVDPGARRLRLATDMAEALGGGTRFAFAAGQLPDHPEEGWAAVTRPAADERGRLCLLATGTAPSFAKGSASGLVLGAWTEVMPHTMRTAAFGVHFDSPAARAPQALLLCTATEEDGYSFELVRDLLLQTLQLARLRLVGAQQLGALGQFLPATYLNGAIPAGAS